MLQSEQIVKAVVKICLFGCILGHRSLVGNGLNFYIAGAVIYGGIQSGGGDKYLGRLREFIQGRAVREESTVIVLSGRSENRG